MIDIEFDFRALVQLGADLGADVQQVPYAASRALNESATKTKEFLANVMWPEHVHRRRSNFPAVALHIDYSTKYDLQVKIYDRLQRGHLYELTYGGIKVPYGQHLAIPIIDGAYPFSFNSGGGIAQRDHPAELIATTPRRAMRVIPDKGIFIGGLVRGELRMVYAFKREANIPKQVPFDQEFERYFLEEFERQFPYQLAMAMVTAKPHRS